LASLGFRAWALIIALLFEYFIRTLCMWFKVSWFPILQYDIAIAKKMLYFTTYSTLEAISGWFTSDIDKIFIGRFLGVFNLGIYNLGYNFAMMPLVLLVTPVNTVLYPAFCSVKENKEELKRYYFKYLSWVMFILYPISLLIFFLAPYLIPFILGDKWIGSINIVRIMSIYCFIVSLIMVNPEIFRAINRPDLQVKLALARIIISIPTYYIFAQYNLFYFCIAYLTVGTIFVPVSFLICNRILKVTLKEIKDFLKTYVVIANFGMAIIFVLVRYLSNLLSLNLYVYISTLIFITILYFMISLKYDREKIEKLRLIFSNQQY
jgi:O-antigen/teichoic acid export membrane protein